MPWTESEIPKEDQHQYEIVMIDKTDNDHLVMQITYTATTMTNTMVAAKIAMALGVNPSDFQAADCGCPDDGSEHKHE